MFLVDNLLLGPGKAAMFVFQELARKAQEDWLDDESIKQELQEIYALVEGGKISSQDFEARECRLLERLEQIAKAKFKDKWGQQNATTVIDAVPIIVEETPVIEHGLSTAALLPLEAVAAPSASVCLELPASYGEPPRPLPPPPVPSPESTLLAPAPAPAPAPASASAPAPAPLGVAFAAPAPPTAMTAPATGLSIGQVVESTKGALSLLNLKLSAITSVSPGDDGWRVTAELIERKGVPDTNDQIGVYEFRLDGAGNVMRYERTRLRRRGDLGR